VSVVGATLGFTLMGGRMSAGAAIGGMIGGLAAGLALLFFHRIIVTDSNQPQWGAVIAAGALAVAIEAIALESRHDALEEAPFIDVPNLAPRLHLAGPRGHAGRHRPCSRRASRCSATRPAPPSRPSSRCSRWLRRPSCRGAFIDAWVAKARSARRTSGWLASLAVAGAGILAASVELVRPRSRREPTREPWRCSVAASASPSSRRRWERR
jgi:hypothetical protein